MKAKSETFSNFQEYKALVENHISRNMHYLRYDNGGELESNVFNNFCSDGGISRELIIPYNP